MLHRPELQLTTGLMCFALAACAGNRSTQAVAPKTRYADIGLEEITATFAAAPNVYDLILARRAGFLTSRMPRTLSAEAPNVFTPPGPQVYVNGIRVARGVEALRQIPSGGVVRIRYLSSIDAAVRYGANHASGAILVTLR